MLVSSPAVDKSLPVQVDTEVVNACLDDQLAETIEVSQPQQDLDLTIETRVQGVPTQNQQLINNIDSHLPSPIDNFLDSISLPIMQHLLDGGPMTPMTNSTRAIVPNQHINPTPSANKRHSSRLAQKAEANSGKDAIQIAQDLLVKKLGELSGSVVQQSSDEFDLYAKHFDRPIDKSKTEAIKVLIEEGIKQRKKGNNRKTATVAPGLVV